MSGLWNLSYAELCDRISEAHAAQNRLWTMCEYYRRAISRLELRLTVCGTYPYTESRQNVQRLLHTARVNLASTETDYQASVAISRDLDAEMDRIDPPRHWQRRDGSRYFRNHPRKVYGKGG